MIYIADDYINEDKPQLNSTSFFSAENQISDESVSDDHPSESMKELCMFIFHFWIANAALSGDQYTHIHKVHESQYYEDDYKYPIRLFN